MKAFLVWKDQEPPKTHDLIELAKLCTNFDAGFLQLGPKCEYLVPFATRIRYPGTGVPNAEDIKKALSYAQDIIELVKVKITL